MKTPKHILLPGILFIAAAGLLTFWLLRGTDLPMALRVPGTDHAPENALGTNANAVLAGKLIRSATGPVASLPGAWPQFRGSQGDGISHETNRLARQWAAGEPKQLWAIDAGEGYAGAAIFNSRVYLIDYDRAKKQDAFRCLSLADGQEIWRFAYPVPVKRNHGMSRTVPTVNERIAVAMGPKCQVACLNPETGELLWGLDLAQEYGTTVPQWYAGQCPLVETGRVILAPAGKEVLMVALDETTGKPLWRAPNPREWNMTHSSIVPTVIAGERQYIYCGHGGVAGVSANTGKILWDTTDWKIGIATVPTPIVVGEGRIFFTGGYNAGSLMLQVVKEGEQFTAKTVFRLKAEVFGATQQTPILYENHLYGVRADGAFVCLNLDGKIVWASDKNPSFGLGPFLLADGLIFALNDKGLLRMIEATPRGYSLLSEAQVLQGSDCWGPMALAGGRLIARDLTRMVCLDVSAK
jgi:outer membrane protein assembly factor BamB